MLKPGEIPQYTGDLDQLEIDYADLKKDADNVRKTGEDVHSQFQGLSAYYTAPEAEQLFATTKPVKDRADAFADDLETVASALSSYATEVRPLKAKLEELKARAETFVASVKDDDEWEYDGDKVDEHNQIRDDITATVAAFWAAERTCHNKITALWGGTQMVAGDGSDRKDQYGFSAGDMKNAKVPWGDPVEEKHKWYEVGHWVKSFVWDGLIVDGIWGTIKGLGTLVGFGGWEAMGQAWKGLAQLATGLTLSMMPGAQVAFWALPDDKLPAWIRDSRTAMKETGKALVAWDEWGRNPARAAGAVTFNVVTTVFTGGAGAGVSGAGKAGAAAKVLAAAGKAGHFIDPMTYIAKGAGAGLSKIGDIAKSLKGVGSIDIPALPDNAITLPEGATRLPDGTVNLPEGAAIPEGATRLPDGNFQFPDNTPVLPAGTTKLPSVDGSPAQYMDADGNLLDEHGNVIDTVDNAPTDVIDKGTSGNPASRADVPRVDSPVREPALIGAGTHTADQAGQHIRLGDSAGTDLGDVGRVGDDVPTTPAVHAAGDVPTVRAGGDLPDRGVGDNIPAGRAGDHLPGGHAGDSRPAGRADDVAQGPSASHESLSRHDAGSGGTGHEGQAPSDHDSPGGSSHNDAGGGHHEGPTGADHHASRSGGGSGDGPSGGQAPFRDPDRFSEGDHVASPPTGPMSPDQEAGVKAALDRAKMPAQDQQRLLTRLSKESYGAGVAEYIARGDFHGLPEYRELLNASKQKGMIPAVHQALEYAMELKLRGVEDLAFEYKRPDLGLDLDVLVMSGDEIKYGCQLKDVGQEHSISSAARKIADKQLMGDIDGPKVAILDVHDTRAALTESTVKDVEHYAKKTGSTYQLRFRDGSITIPPNGQIYP
ncbi:hypothetical protein CLM62_20680 [Streptomyces sp. SA15]|uniref:hypothetical protein n=1 Tax=Streptomyces sp. SA15 TaxID=934019 RepID=UPI000BAF7F16|nr:hypothetical protein [Streptomyces sp. SA15]PAZ13907.1 hypothetical protein CLM62_20680 [Streptomyces sp. SA15]